MNGPHRTALILSTSIAFCACGHVHERGSESPLQALRVGPETSCWSADSVFTCADTDGSEAWSLLRDGLPQQGVVLRDVREGYLEVEVSRDVAVLTLQVDQPMRFAVVTEDDDGRARTLASGIKGYPGGDATAAVRIRIPARPLGTVRTSVHLSAHEGSSPARVQGLALWSRPAEASTVHASR